MGFVPERLVGSVCPVNRGNGAEQTRTVMRSGKDPGVNAAFDVKQRASAPIDQASMRGVGLFYPGGRPGQTAR
jgi:hypothetical protein